MGRRRGHGRDAHVLEQRSNAKGVWARRGTDDRVEPVHLGSLLHELRGLIGVGARVIHLQIDPQVFGLVDLVQRQTKTAQRAVTDRCGRSGLREDRSELEGPLGRVGLSCTFLRSFLRAARGDEQDQQSGEAVPAPHRVHTRTKKIPF